MKRFKRLISIIISIFLVCLCYANRASAANLSSQIDKRILAEEDLGPWLGYASVCDDEIELPLNTDSSCQYFQFENDGQRMDSQGNFTFSFSWAMQSTSFKPFATTITIRATATSSNNNKTYYIGVKEVATGNSLGYATYTANGQQQDFQFSGLDLNTSYYLYFSKPILSNATITGSGRVMNIQ